MKSEFNHDQGRRRLLMSLDRCGSFSMASSSTSKSSSCISLDLILPISVNLLPLPFTPSHFSLYWQCTTSMKPGIALSLGLFKSNSKSCLRGIQSYLKWQKSSPLRDELSLCRQQWATRSSRLDSDSASSSKQETRWMKTGSGTISMKAMSPWFSVHAEHPSCSKHSSVRVKRASVFKSRARLMFFFSKYSLFLLGLTLPKVNSPSLCF